MIVQTIEISLSKGRAPDLLAHVAESGREIEMIPDVEISADDYTAEIDTVKPDGTFTMTNCSIDSDGHIIAPIIEQAVAVKGLCHYIIKIYNDDVIVYSACGSLWVDDHLITDDMIESVAEVNGYRFPQDFATLDDIANFINDNSIETGKTWSSDKINNEITNIDISHHYSTSEKLVGKWIDSKPVYEKTIACGELPNSGSISVAHGIANLKRVISIDGTAINPNNNYNIPLPYVVTFGSLIGYQSNIYVDDTNINIIANADLSAYKISYITLQYTKTTD